MSIVDYQNWFEVNPIVLVNGVASNFSGGLLPISQLLQVQASQAGFFPSSDPWFAHFKPLPGAALIKNEVGHYPFANQAVAGNAIIVQPLTVPILMSCPASGPDGFSTKFTIMNALKQTLDQHTALGGLYTLALPTCLYDSCLLLSLECVGDGDGRQAQVLWQWTFERPLITQQQAQQAQSQLMAKISSGTQVTPDQSGNINWSGLQNAAGQPNSSVTSSVLTTGGSGQGVFGGANSPNSLSGPNGQSALNNMD